jgi:APA family basic amino acid/polyamine antiporter
LGVPSAAALVVGNMIGAGVFTTSGYSLAALGTPDRVLVAWAVGGVLALLGAISYGALARRLPESGGEYFFLSRIVHPLAGFLAGWVSLLAGFTAPIALMALALQAYLDPTGEPATRPWIGTAAIALAAGLHGWRLKGGVVVQNAAVLIKLALIGAFIVYGTAHLPPRASLAMGSVPPFELGAFAVTLVYVSFCYSGWNAVVYLASEVRDPDRNLQRSILWGSGCVVLCYLALNYVFVHSAPVSELAGRAEIGAIAGEALGGSWLRRAVTALVALALFTSISAMVMVGPRVYARMAEDGLFPRRFAAWRDVPRSAVALQALLAIGVVWISELRELLGTVGFTLSLSASATVASLMVLRKREGAERVPVPGYPWVPALFIVTTTAAAVLMALGEPSQARIGLAVIAAGLPVYWWMRR